MMKLLKDKEKTINKIFNIYCIFLMIQPIFDIVSNMSNYNIIPFNIVTYIKPLFVFGIFAFIFIFFKFKAKKKYFLYYTLLAIFLALHSGILHFIFVDKTTIIHELRFCINIIYFATIYFTLKIMYDLFANKKEFFDKLKKNLFITIVIYVILYIIAVLTGTSWLTYEFSDSTKLGYRGWYYSGQIFGHFLSVSLPFIVFQVFNSKKNIFTKILLISLVSVPLLLIGTKVPYFILIIVLILNVFISLFYKVLHKEMKINWSSIFISLVFIIASILVYTKIPVYNNIQINSSVAGTEYKEENILEQHEKSQKKLTELSKKIDKKEKKSIQERRIELANEYDWWTLESLEELNVLYANGKMHSSDNRNRQLYFMYYKFQNSTIPFKLLGLGYVNQPNQLSMERDIIMPLFSFGIIGFLLFTGFLWILLGKTMIYALINIKNIDKEFIILAESFCMFFFISYFAGATYIYTQFANILAVLIALLYIKMKILNEDKNMIKSLRNITTQTYDEVIGDLTKLLKKDKKKFVITANPETIMLSEKNENTQKMLSDAEILKVPDGIAVVKACQKYNMDVKHRITGCDLSVSLLELANKMKKSLYLFGAKPEVIKEMERVIKEKYPNIKLLKAQDGYVKDRDKVKKDIIKKQPDICLVALGIPHQENFIYDIIDKVDKGIYMGVGGTFDVLSGTKKRAPKLFIKLNIEWLYRIISEPFRIKRFIQSNMKFIFQIFF